MWSLSKVYLQLNLIILAASIGWTDAKKVKPPPPPNTLPRHQERFHDKYIKHQIENWDPELSKQNAWELSGKFEGDIMIDEPFDYPYEDEAPERNIIKSSGKRWPKGRVPYYIAEDFDDDDYFTILGAMAEIHQKSCVRFKEYTTKDKSALLIHANSSGCWSYVGRQGKTQIVNLQQNCVHHGIVVHELLHALGFYHQQSAADRDNYVTINYENILPKRENNFRKYTWDQVTDFDVGYDYKSVMHYSAYAFSKNGKKTITTLKIGEPIGQRNGMSKKDAAKLNKMYNCKRFKKPKVPRYVTQSHDTRLPFDDSSSEDDEEQPIED